MQGPRAGVRGRGLPSLATLQPLLLPPGHRQQPGLGRRPAPAGHLGPGEHAPGAPRAAPAQADTRPAAEIRTEN